MKAPSLPLPQSTPSGLFGLLIVAGILLSPFSGGTTARGEGIGAYFTLVNTYIYRKGPREGPATLVRPRLAFNVVDLTVDGKDEIWYLIIYPPKTIQVKGLGWTPKAPHELIGGEEESVLVYSKIPEKRNGTFTVYKAPLSGLKLLNESQSSNQFTQLVWQKVQFRLDQPLRAWVRGKAGIYRVGKQETFLSRVYGEMVTRNLEKNKRMRLLSGVVRIGDTLREVNWALGEPLHNQVETVANTKRTTWQYPEFAVMFENEVVKQIE